MRCNTHFGVDGCPDFSAHVVPPYIWRVVALWPRVLRTRRRKGGFFGEFEGYFFYFCLGGGCAASDSLRNGGLGSWNGLVRELARDFNGVLCLLSGILLLMFRS